MKQMSTKKRIITEALHLFSEKGYNAVSVGQIADAVGIKAPSLYKHYKNKQAIFDAILMEMQQQYDKQVSSMEMNGVDAALDLALFEKISEEQLIQLGKNLFLYFLHDDYVCQFRKMLMIEQHHNTDLAAIFTKQYIEGPLSYQGILFSMLVNAGIFINENPNVMALQFYGPINLLLTLCDCQPKREQEALQMLQQHIKQFNKIYKAGGAK